MKLNLAVIALFVAAIAIADNVILTVRVDQLERLSILQTRNTDHLITALKALSDNQGKIVDTLSEAARRPDPVPAQKTRIRAQSL